MGREQGARAVRGAGGRAAGGSGRQIGARHPARIGSTRLQLAPQEQVSFAAAPGKTTPARRRLTRVWRSLKIAGNAAAIGSRSTPSSGSMWCQTARWWPQRIFKVNMAAARRTKSSSSICTGMRPLILQLSSASVGSHPADHHARRRRRALLNRALRRRDAVLQKRRLLGAHQLLGLGVLQAGGTFGMFCGCIVRG